MLHQAEGIQEPRKWLTGAETPGDAITQVTSVEKGYIQAPTMYYVVLHRQTLS